MFLVFDHFQNGKIEKTSRQFIELRDLARTRLCAIKQFPGTNVFARLKRQVALSKLNAMLSFYGWAIKRDGTMVEVRVRGEPVDLNLLENDSLRYGSIEDVNEWARRYYAATGVLRDPRDGRELAAVCQVDELNGLAEHEALAVAVELQIGWILKERVQEVFLRRLAFSRASDVSLKRVPDREVAVLWLCVNETLKPHDPIIAGPPGSSLRNGVRCLKRSVRRIHQRRHIAYPKGLSAHKLVQLQFRPCVPG